MFARQKMITIIFEVYMFLCLCNSNYQKFEIKLKGQTTSSLRDSTVYRDVNPCNEKLNSLLESITSFTPLFRMPVSLISQSITYKVFEEIIRNLNMN